MASFLRTFATALAALAFPLTTLAQGVGVGTATPDAAAVLDVTSTSQGLLLPRMKTFQRAAIVNPPQGLFVFQTDGTPGLYYYVGSAWVNISNGLIPDAAGNAGISPVVQVTTLAGSGAAAYADGTGVAAQFFGPTGVAADGSGNVYVAELNNHRIRKIVAATGVVSTLAGSGTTGFADGPGAAAQFANPAGVAVDGSGDVYVADQGNHRIRKIIATTGMVSTLAGSGTAGFADGTGAGAQFFAPYGVAADGSNVYVADQLNHRIRKIVATTGVVSTLAGSGTAGSTNGTGTAAQFFSPAGVAVDGSGDVYVADQGIHRIRKIVATTGVVSTLAGSGTAGFVNGTGAAAQFANPTGVAVDGSGNVYVADQGNQRIRAIKP